MKNPILIDLPVPIYTERLILRPPQMGDGKQVHEAVTESFADLTQWMPWAKEKQSLDESELFVRTSCANWVLRTELVLFIFDRKTDLFLGATGFHDIDWDIPSFETGYWIRSSHKNKGIVTEATQALILYAFKQLQAKRLAIRCDEDNQASRRIPEKLGFTLEGILKNNALKCHNKGVRNTVIYARYNDSGLPSLDITW